MGVAAQHRGNAVIARNARAELSERRQRQELARVAQISEDCEVFARLAMEYLVEPRGLREAAVLRARQRRGWAKREQAVIAAHNAWVDADRRSTPAVAAASVRRAQALHALLVYALGDWTIPQHIAVPRAARSC
ncbi:hypothetical protein [Pulveribacter sp.]|uniref:hypothetical protein n=1 Tax=Pulveribacter sp. TaxID=2678893 RepID=UPI0028A80EC1|nr:hypothetical protein [Pulveribacter sp.]